MLSGPRDVEHPPDQKDVTYFDAVDADQQQLDVLAADLEARGIGARVSVSKLASGVKATSRATLSGDVLIIEEHSKNQIGFISTFGGTREDDWSTPSPLTPASRSALVRVGRGL